MKAKVNKVTIQIIQGDILNLEVDGLVNATDPNLTISETLLAKTGQAVVDECRLIGWCDVGSAVVTGAGNLEVQKIIHAAGPKWGETSARGNLANATWAALQRAEENELKTIAIPPISTGSFGYPVENCAKTMLSQILDFTFEQLKYVRNIIICTQTETEADAFQAEFKQQIQYLQDSGEGNIRLSKSFVIESS